MHTPFFDYYNNTTPLILLLCHNKPMRRIAVRGIIVNDNKLLCVKLKPYAGVLQGDYWCLPGGTVDEGESLIHALKRELNEELATDGEIGSLLFINQFLLNDTDHLEFFFEIKNVQDFLELDLSKASHAAEEIAEVAFIDTSKNHILPSFLTEKSANEHLQSKAQVISS